MPVECPQVKETGLPEATPGLNSTSHALAERALMASHTQNTCHGEITNRLKKTPMSYGWTFSTSARTFAINSNVAPEFSLR